MKIESQPVSKAVSEEVKPLSEKPVSVGDGLVPPENPVSGAASSSGA